jgi:hypothetical protein
VNDIQANRGRDMVTTKQVCSAVNSRGSVPQSGAISDRALKKRSFNDNSDITRSGYIQTHYSTAVLVNGQLTPFESGRI